MLEFLKYQAALEIEDPSEAALQEKVKTFSKKIGAVIDKITDLTLINLSPSDKKELRNEWNKVDKIVAIAMALSLIVAIDYEFISTVAANPGLISDMTASSLESVLVWLAAVGVEIGIKKTSQKNNVISEKPSP
jgi:hypothetical protein